ncbi:histidine kinase [Dysgonomonas sp. Marseille-P4677]|uniref:DUF6268 family outer membrane beta-barrel protein n=1 Tax=Dysgonomonas sp. Marseille-P4677 TaxID=2364790 RepID=UPI00191234AB|nr:DUF6268 family outer membrane beta-barrel protein [Dysgonomonas sp. Marseille-P4677]MBK5722015.1 histidine kinase [Dysgonomonas sp. Marseille-P4677]
MKLVLYSIAFIFLVINTDINAQISFKTEYVGKSSLIDNERNKIGIGNSGAMVYKGGINIPLSMKIDKNNHPQMWGVGASGSYVSFNNEGISKDLVLSELMNAQIAVFHTRYLNDKWSMMASVGVGLYMPNTKFSKITGKNVLGNVGVIFIRHLKPNLEIGGGLAMNNTFGYPMIFPALYFNWMYEGRFTFKLSMMDGGEISAKYNVNKALTLGVVSEMSGQGAMLEMDGKDMMFSHQYIVTGFRPEIKIGKKFLIPITIGVSMVRSASFEERSLKEIFGNKGVDSDFKESFYISAGFKYQF